MMNIFMTVRSQTILCCLWLILIVLAFVICAGSSIRLLGGSGASLDGWKTPPLTGVVGKLPPIELSPITPESASPGSMNLKNSAMKENPSSVTITPGAGIKGDSPEPLVASRKGQPQAPLASQQQGTGVASGSSAVKDSGGPETGSYELGVPEIVLGRESFEVRFFLSRPVNGITTSFQKSPAAWMIDLPGEWKRSGKEEVAYDHSVVRKLRITPGKEYTRLKLYCTRRDEKQSQPPVIVVKDLTLSVKVNKP